MAPSSLNVLVLLPLSEAQRTRLEAGAPGARYAYVAPAPGSMLGSPSPSVSPSATRYATRPPVPANLAGSKPNPRSQNRVAHTMWRL